MLYSYSETFKRKMVIGNLIIALLGFLFIVLLWIIEFFALRNSAGSFVVVYPSFLKINVLMGGYALFAFLTTLIREIIKDMEDVEGDKSNGCQTIPISKGINLAIWSTKLYGHPNTLPISRIAALAAIVP